MRPNCLEIEVAHFNSREKLYSIADRCFDLSNVIISNLQAREVDKKHMTKCQVILVFNFYKSVKTFLAIMQLCDRGLAGDAMALCRKLLEGAITLTYLMKIGPEAVRRYWFYDILQQYRTVKREFEDNWTNSKNRWSPDAIKGMRDNWQNIRAKYLRVKRFYPLNGSGEIRNEYFQNWSGATLASMATEIDLTNELSAYSYYSGKVHSSVDDITSYYNCKDSSFGFAFDTVELPFVMVQAIRFFRIIEKAIIDEFKFDLSKSVESIYLELEELYQKGVVMF